jgi:hypothetical protein
MGAEIVGNLIQVSSGRAGDANAGHA